MSIFTRSLWPATVRRPYLRLGIAMLVAPVLVALLLSLAGYLIHGASMPTRAEALAETHTMAEDIAFFVFLFTVSFGTIGVAMLWALAQRGALAWTMTGVLMGGIAGTLISLMAYGAVDRAVLLLSAALSWALFLMIRRIAGIRED